MGETKSSSENRLKQTAKYSDENRVPLKAKNNNAQSNLKPRSIWGSNIVKGFAAEKKTRSQQVTKKSHLTVASTTNSRNPLVPNRAKQSLIGDLSCSATATQVHPQGFNRSSSSSSSSSDSRDLFAELDQLRTLLQESRDGEAKLQEQLKASEIDDALKGKIDLLESENSISLSNRQPQESITKGVVDNVEVDVLKLRRLNAELHFQKRNLCCRISSMESQLAALAKDSENESVEKIKAEASLLRQKNEDLCKQVEDLQVSRLNEVEELVYLRWVNSCLKKELQNSAFVTSDIPSSPVSGEWLNGSISSDESSEHGSTRKRLSLIKKWHVLDKETNASEPNIPWLEGRRHSISGANCCQEDLMMNKRRQSDGFICSLEGVNDSNLIQGSRLRETTKLKTYMDAEKRASRVPNPPPTPSSFTYKEHKELTVGLWRI
ncbi:putative protein CHUP1 [Helianthus anomalus]